MTNQIHGADISANHGAFVTLNHHGTLESWTGYTFAAAGAKLPSYIRLEARKTGSKQQDAMNRFFNVSSWMIKPRDMYTPPAEGCCRYLAIEDYAFAGRAGQHSTAQVGGMLRYAVMSRGHRNINMRLHAPGTIGLYVFGEAKGGADKIATRRAVIAMHPDASGLPEDPEGDLIDAYVMAKIMWLEVEVRAGRVALENLTTGQRQIFLRTTTSFPENLLARPFIR